MLELDHKLKLSQDIAHSANLTSHFGEDDLRRIGMWVREGYDRDVTSRAAWYSRTRAAMELALQVKPEKSFPWPNAANVAFPLVTIAALQYHARIYPQLFSGPDIVKYRVPGVDMKGDLNERAALIGRFMSYQALNEDVAFEEQHDRLEIAVPIVGCGFVKTRRDAARHRNVSEYVPAEDLVIDYFAKSVEEAQRKTQHVLLYRNQIYERCRRGTFRNILEEPWYQSASTPIMDQGAPERDRVQGRSLPQGDKSSLFFLEQHTWLDLDGDGYEEPYIVTIEFSTNQVVRLVARWEAEDDVERNDRGQVIVIRATEYFTKYGLIPSPDGGIYDIGFGFLLGPLNESVDTIVNQLIDNGTLKVAGGGFIARGVKIKGGAVSFRPFQWNTVESTGDDLRKGIFPIPVGEPSAVLFQLLTLLINYTQRISGSTDVMTGENPGQNTPAHNMQAMVEQGQKIFAATFKRQWRSMGQEFQKLFILNGRHLPDEFMFGSMQMGRELFLADPTHVIPVADPSMTSESQRAQQALTVKQAAMTTPGYNLQEVERMFLRSLKIDNIEVIYPGPDKVPPLPNPKQMVEQQKTEREKMKLDFAREEFALGMMEERRLNNAKILQLEAQAAKFVSDAEDADAAHQLKVLEAQIGALKEFNGAINQRLELMLKASEPNGDGSPGGGGGVAKAPGHQGLPNVPVAPPPGLDGGMGGGATGPGL